MANASLKKRRVRGINSDIDKFVLKGEKFRAQVTQGIRTAELRRTIEGASTVTFELHDPQIDLLSHPLLQEKVDAELDGLWFRLAAFAKRGDTCELVFEDREVATLRQLTKSRKAFRDQVTRAEFVRSLVREARPRIPMYIKELHKEQPIAQPEFSGATIDFEKAKAGGIGKGIDPGAELTVKGQPASRIQITLGGQVLAVAASLGAPSIVMIAVIAAVIAESTMQNLSYGDSSSVGILQLLDLHGSVQQRMDVARSVTMFVQQGFTGAGGALALARQGLGPAEIAARVQGNAAGTASYSPWVAEATEWVRAFSGGDLKGKSGSITTMSEKRFGFGVEANEDYWDAIQRLAEEVKWRAFMSAGVFYYAAEEDLLRNEPMMRVRGRKQQGIDDIDYDYDGGKTITEAQLTVRVKEWAIPPGTVVQLSERKFGPAVGGRYLVSDINSSLFSELATVIIKKPTPSIPEPAPETVSQTSQFGDVVGGTLSPGALAARLADVDIKKGGWAGTEAVMKQVVQPFMNRYDLSCDSAKEGGHAEGGDHDPNVKNAYACDFPTTAGEAAAKALASALGYKSWAPNSYATFNVKVGKATFRFQILWGAGIDHGDHVHVGIRRVS